MLSAVLANATQSGMDDTPAEVIFLVFGFSNSGCNSRCYKKKQKKKQKKKKKKNRLKKQFLQILVLSSSQ